MTIREQIAKYIAEKVGEFTFDWNDDGYDIERDVCLIDADCILSLIQSEIEKAIGRDVIAHEVLGTELDRAFVRGMNTDKKEIRTNLQQSGLLPVERVSEAKRLTGK